MFQDYSQVVFSAVGFLRYRINEKKNEPAFVFGKTMVAPLKVLSFPKLSLQAVTVG